MNIALPKGNGEWFFLTNEELQIDDKVFPLAYTYHTNGKVFITGMILLSDDPESIIACTGWPSEPHIIRKFYIEEGINWIRTDKGYSPADVYFKVINI